MSNQKMRKITIPISDGQMSKLRNFHPVRLTKKHFTGKGVEVVVNPMNYDNFNRHLKRNKGFMLKLGKEEVEANKEMEGAGIFKKLKKAGKSIKKGYNSRVKNTPLGQALRDTAGNLIEMPYDMVAQKLDNQYTGDLADYMKNNREKNVNYVVRKSGLGLRAGRGLRGGSMKCCSMCGGAIMQDDLFLLEMQNSN